MGDTEEVQAEEKECDGASRGKTKESEKKHFRRRNVSKPAVLKLTGEGGHGSSIRVLWWLSTLRC